MGDILVVDDEQAIRESISMFLSEKGHRIHTADTVAASLTAFESLKPCVVILDIRLPDGNGLDALARMRSIYPLSKIIMITAFLCRQRDCGEKPGHDRHLQNDRHGLSEPGRRIDYRRDRNRKGAGGKADPPEQPL